MDSDSDRETTTSCQSQNPLNDFLPQIREELSHLDLSGSIVFKETKVQAGGTFSDIIKARYLLPGRGKVTVAVKRLRFYNGADIKILFEKEIYIWSKLEHVNILPLLGFAFDKPTGYPLLVSEWMSKGSAWVYVNANPKLDIMHLVIGIAKGLTYLHKANIVHSDIKADNVVVSNSGDALICDFGCARMIAASRSIARPSSGIKGTVRYTAFEILAHLEEGIPVGYTEESDMWSFGMTVYELLMRQRPYNHLTEIQVPSAITRRELPSFLASNSHTVHFKTEATLSKVCKDCWNHDPSERSDIETILRELRIAPNRLATKNKRNGKVRKAHQYLLAHSPSSPFIMACPTRRAILNNADLGAPPPLPENQSLSFQPLDEGTGASSFASEVADALRVVYAKNDGDQHQQRDNIDGPASSYEPHAWNSPAMPSGLPRGTAPHIIPLLASNHRRDNLKSCGAPLLSEIGSGAPGEVKSDDDDDRLAEHSTDIDRHSIDLGRQARWGDRMKRIFIDFKSSWEVELGTSPKSLHPY